MFASTQFFMASSFVASELTPQRDALILYTRSPTSVLIRMKSHYEIGKTEKGEEDRRRAEGGKGCGKGVEGGELRL